MVTLLEGRRTGEFMVSEAQGMRSREVGVFINGGTVELDLPAGLVLGQVTADSSFAPYTNAGTLGLQTGVAILWDNVRIPAAGTVHATYIARDAEVNAGELMYDISVDAPGKAAALVDLRAVGIIPR